MDEFQVVCMFCNSEYKITKYPEAEILHCINCGETDLEIEEVLEIDED